MSLSNGSNKCLWIPTSLASLALAITAGLNCYLFYVCLHLAGQGNFIGMSIAALTGVFVLASLGFCASIAIQFARGGGHEPAALARQLGEVVSAFFQSSAFYYMSGIAFIIVAFVCQQNGTNSTFVFLLALLGVAILLYGTGSQAMLSLGQGGGAQTLDPRTLETFLKDKLKEPDKAAEVSRDVITVTGRPAGQYANFAVAGGAAALTAFFGWAITERQEAIRAVFRDHTRHMGIVIEPSVGELSAFKISARVEEGPDMYVRPGVNVVYIISPEQGNSESLTIKLTLTKIQRNTDALVGLARKYSDSFSVSVTLGESEGCRKLVGDGRSPYWTLFDRPNVEWRCKVPTINITEKEYQVSEQKDKAFGEIRPETKSLKIY